MSNRTLLVLVALLIVVFLIVKFNVVTNLIIIATNWVYGNEVRDIKGILVVVDSPLPDLEKDGLSKETIRQDLIPKLEKAGIKSLTEVEWQKIREKAAFKVKVVAAKTGDHQYQYTVTMDVMKSEFDAHSAGFSSDKIKILWSINNIGEGDVSAIRSKINEQIELFLKAYSGA